MTHQTYTDEKRYYRTFPGQPETAFWIAGCRTCGILLNSGYHYASLEAAKAETDRHKGEK